MTVDGCKGLAQLAVLIKYSEVYRQPNIFLPNRNGNNEFFTIYGGPEMVNVNKLQIFNRWGGLLFETGNFQPNVPSFGWNGKYNGELVNPGVYAWYAEVEMIDGRTIILKGDVTLIR